MNCEEFRSYWSDWHDGHGGVDEIAMARHRDTCPDCARYDREMRSLLGGLSTLPLPGEPAGRRRRLPAGAPRWAALAATLVIGIALGLVLAQRDEPGTTLEAKPVDLASAGEQRIAIAIDSPRAYDEVEFVVELPEGVELEGFPGQRQVRWTGRLAEGRSRLRLPLRVLNEARGGDLVARVRHPGGERRLVVPLTDGSAALQVERASV
ncbi:anti-sigma factor family protein [Halofilum ochraceum]|uniref:anti-sigma factor family protein n=1 Tax=Halofilum ochraceum TaxID=1611323 RepID=UPI00083246D3|nr:hypothetical protein [Halofilum ochraceum]